MSRSIQLLRKKLTSSEIDDAVVFAGLVCSKLFTEPWDVILLREDEDDISTVSYQEISIWCEDGARQTRFCRVTALLFVCDLDASISPLTDNWTAVWIHQLVSETSAKNEGHVMVQPFVAPVLFRNTGSMSLTDKHSTLLISRNSDALHCSRQTLKRNAAARRLSPQRFDFEVYCKTARRFLRSTHRKLTRFAKTNHTSV